jgi:hypothetical protein
VFLREGVELFAQEDVFFRNVGEEEFEFGGVEGAGERVGDYLVEGGTVAGEMIYIQCTRGE